MGKACSRVLYYKGHQSLEDPPACAVPEKVAKACGPVGHLFFEPAGAVTMERWHFAGEGKGSYAKMQSFSFVGHSHGTFDKSSVTTNYARNAKRCCVGLVVSVLLAGAAYAMLTFQHVRTHQREHPQSEFFSALQPGESFEEAPVSQPEDTDAQAVHNLSTMPSPTSLPVGEQQPEAAHGLPGYEVRYNCATGPQEALFVAAVESEWHTVDQDKNRVVTRSELLAQAATLSNETLALLLDADVDGDGGLSQEEFAAALRHSRKSVADLPTRADVTHFHARRIQAWSKEKRSWCCAHAGVGCTTTSSGAPTITKTTTTAAAITLSECRGIDPGEMALWLPQKKAWCCRYTDIGCPVQSTTEQQLSATTAVEEDSSEAFDCKVALTAWQISWSGEKKSWCCIHKGSGCPPARLIPTPSLETPPAFDCELGSASWAAVWPLDKKSWCCAKAGKGCPVD